MKLPAFSRNTCSRIQLPAGGVGVGNKAAVWSVHVWEVSALRVIVEAQTAVSTSAQPWDSPPPFEPSEMTPFGAEMSCSHWVLPKLHMCTKQMIVGVLPLSLGRLACRNRRMETLLVPPTTHIIIITITNIIQSFRTFCLANLQCSHTLKRPLYPEHWNIPCCFLHP